MMPMAQEYADKLNAFLPSTRSWSGTTFASPVTGDMVVSPKLMDPRHWVRNMTSPVLFSQAFESMCFGQRTSDDAGRHPTQGANIDIIVEVGAHGTLGAPIKQILDGRVVDYVSCLKRYVDAIDTMQDVVCELHVRGYPVALEAVNAPLTYAQHRYVHDLPSYAWKHATRYWSEPRIHKEHRHRQFSPHELLGTLVPGSNRLQSACTHLAKLFTYGQHLMVGGPPA